jgi:DNA-binding NarL/FixJ family response regulator
MPEAAARTGAVELVLTPAEIAQTLHRWTEGRLSARRFEPSTATDAAPPTRILLVDDHRIVLDGLRVLLDGEADMTVVAGAEDGFTAVEAAAALAPDVVVMDIRMPGLDGVEATRQILASAPSTKVVALSSDSDARAVDGILRAGATGYLTKHRAFGELVQAIRTVMKGKVYLSREVASMVTAGSVTAPAPRRPRL